MKTKTHTFAKWLVKLTPDEWEEVVTNVSISGGFSEPQIIEDAFNELIDDYT